MRRRLTSLAGPILMAALLQGCGHGPSAGRPDPQIAEATARAQKAAADFAALVAAHPNEPAPRQDAPGVKPLLDAVLDTQALRLTAPKAFDMQPIIDWQKAVLVVYRAYELSGTGLTTEPAAGDKAKTFSYDTWTTNNVRRYPDEMGRALDALSLLSQAMDQGAEAGVRSNPAYFSDPKLAKSLGTFRESIIRQLGNSLVLMQVPGLPDEWRRARLAAISGFVPAVTPYISATDSSSLHHLTLDLIRCETDGAMRGSLTQIAAALPDKQPRTPQAEAAHDRLADAACRSHKAILPFEERALPARTGAPMPRQSDPAIKAQLDAILETGAVPADPAPEDVKPLIDWTADVVKVYFDYIYADTGITGLAAYEPKLDDPTVNQQVERNVVAYSVEFGRAADAQARLMRPICSAIAIANRAGSPTAMPEQQRKAFDLFRNSVGQATIGLLTAIESTHLGDSWRRERLTAINELIPAAAAILRPEDAKTLRDIALEHAKTEHDPGARAKLLHIAAALPV